MTTCSARIVPRAVCTPDGAAALDQQSRDLAVAEGRDRLVAAQLLRGAHAPWRSRRRPRGGRPRWSRDRAAGRARRPARGRAAAPRGRSRAPAPSGGRARPSARRSWRPRCCPTGWKAPSAVSFSTVHCARRVIVRDALCWKTSPGACEVEPPVWNSGPWSTTTISSQPRSARWWATPAPAMPAPTTTTRADSGGEVISPPDISVVVNARRPPVRRQRASARRPRRGRPP